MSSHIDMIAFNTAREIEDEFARSHPGGVVQRRAKVQVHVINAIREALQHVIGGLIAAIGDASATDIARRLVDHADSTIITDAVGNRFRKVFAQDLEELARHVSVRRAESA